MIINKSYLFFLLVLGVACIPLASLFHPGLPITHDGQDHVVRIANFYQNIKEGNIIPRWAENLNWGYGHPILMYLYPLPSYSASMFHFLGFSFVNSTKIIFGIAFLFSGLTMYIFMQEMLGSQAGFIAAMLYQFAPYRFIDLYVRGAIGEHVAFIFPPLVCYFLLRLSKKYSFLYVVGGSLSLSGLILSHNAIMLMFLPVLFLYAVYLGWQNKKNKLLVMHYTLIACFGFALSSFFWVPAFFEGKYTLRDIVTKDAISSFTQFKDFIYGSWNYGGTVQFTKQVGILQWFVTIAMLPVLVVLKRNKNNFWVINAGLIFIFFIALFMMMPISQFIWRNITILQKFQFPWRFLSMTVFITAIFGGFFIFVLPKKFKAIAVFVFLCLVLFFNKDFWHANGYLLKRESFYTDVYAGTTDTGESAPIWSVRFMEHRPKASIEIIDGQGIIQENQRIITRHVYTIFAKERVRMRENTLYFPGWHVFVDGKESTIEFQDQQNRGLMTFYVEKGDHIIHVEFSETKLRIIANGVSIMSLVILVLYGILEKNIIWRRFRLY